MESRFESRLLDLDAAGRGADAGGDLLPLAVGVLVNTRGLVGLVILNVGLDLHIISPTLFSMMVIMALTTTLMTGPLIDRILPAPRSSL